MAPQSLYEMYVVCTRPVAQNGLGFPPAACALRRSGAGSNALRTTSGDEQRLRHREVLVAKYGVAGKPCALTGASRWP